MARGRRCVFVAAALALAIAVSASGCGGGDDTSTVVSAVPRATGKPGGNGTLAYTLPSTPSNLDPLFANTVDAQTVAAQIYEPLVEELSGPYGDLRRRRGLALSWAPSRDRTAWQFHLRRGVRFADGSSLDADAILANAERWSSVAAGKALLPGLIGADAPRPGVVRFLLKRPSRNFPALLASPRLGLVSPAAFRPRSGKKAELVRPGGAGCGPFVLEHRSDIELDLARNRTWWGSQVKLGPALDAIRFVGAASESQRAGLLSAGQAQAASELGSATARRIQQDPLLTALPSGGNRWLGLERSVRDLRSGAASFSGVWLTRIRAR